MVDREKEQRPQPRAIESIRPEERGQLYGVVAWRIWDHSIFSGWDKEYAKAYDEAAGKPLAIQIQPDKLGYYTVWNRHEINSKHKTPLLACDPGVLDRPSFLLEPLTTKEVARIDELGEAPGPIGSTDRSNELFRSNDLKNIFERSER